MSTSPLGKANVSPLPAPSTYPELCERYEAAMFRINDALVRAIRNFNVTAPDSMDVMYADRQLMLAGQYIDEVRVALELIRQHWVAEGSFAGDTEDVVAPIEDEAVNPTLIAKGGA